MNNELRELVKKHFNLVDSKEEMSEEVVSEQNFGEIRTADGELTLTYEGEELAVGLPIFVVTEDGNVPAPDGEHALEGGVTIETEGGSITEIKETEIEAEEKEEIASEEKMSEETKDEEGLPESEEVFKDKEDKMEDKEEIVMAIADYMMPIIEEMKKDIEEMKDKFSTTEKKVESFGLQPAAERTKAEIKNRNTSKTSIDYNPINEDKKKQFERLLKIRNKK